MIHRALRFLNDWYALTWLWVYIGAFIIAICFMFMWPIVTIMLLFAALASLPISIVGGRVLQNAECVMSLRSLRQGQCPLCLRSELVALEPGISTCMACGTQFSAAGARVQQSNAQTPGRASAN